VEPLPLQHFLRYAEWFHRSFVPQSDPADVARVDLADGGVRVTTVSGDEVQAGNAVLALGVTPFPRVPPVLGASGDPRIRIVLERTGYDDLAGKRVAVIGTGCSAIQVVPAIQPMVEQLDVYQRSPGWTVPKGDYAYPDWAHALFKRVPPVRRLDRAAVFASMELGAAAMTRHRWLLPAIRAVARRQITQAIDDPELRRKVTPSDELGCKRMMLTDEWYPALAKPNVELVTDRIAEVTSAGIRDEAGVERAADVLVLATGFATHGFVAPMEIVGRDGRTLAQEWAEVARAYLGLSVPGFPNMFLLYGPNTNGGTGSVIYTIEAGIGHVLAALGELERAEASRIEVRREAAERFDAELRDALAGTVWHSGCTNWYVDENGNDPQQWPWLWSTYRRRTARLAPGAYELSGAAEPVTAAALG